MWYNKGKALFKLEHLEELLKAYDQALELNNEYSWAWFMKGKVLFKLKHFNEALKCFDHFLELDPGMRMLWSGVWKFWKKYIKGLCSLWLVYVFILVSYGF